MGVPPALDPPRVVEAVAVASCKVVHRASFLKIPCLTTRVHIRLIKLLHVCIIGIQCLLLCAREDADTPSASSSGGPGSGLVCCTSNARQ